MSEKYTCIGDVRGRCGIMHRSRETALACCRSDGAGCAAQSKGGYSDRGVYAVDSEGREEYSDPDDGD